MGSLWLRLRILFSKDKDYFYAIRNIFGYYPGNIFLYKLAFRHKSVAQPFVNGERLSNERLEFLGDAILDAVVAHYLFKLFPLRDEGFLTEMRSKIVSRQQLNKLSQKLGLDTLIIANRDTSQAKSISGDALEAFIGALFLDKGFHFASEVLINRVFKVYFDLDELQHTDFNFKSKLIEWGQKEKHSVDYQVVKEEGSGSNRQYVILIRIDDREVCQAKDFSIKGAEQLASEKALTLIREIRSPS